MSTKEEYLQKLEDRWLEKLSDNYKALNKNIIFLYTLALFLLLLQFNSLGKVELAGSELKLTFDQWLILMPFLILIPYFLVNNSVNQIYRIAGRLKDNSTELLIINPEARPFLNQDIGIYSQGIAGIQFQLAGWIVKYFLTREIMNIAFKIPEKRTRLTIIFFSIRLPFILIGWLYRLGEKILESLLWALFLVLLYVLPLFLALTILVYKKVYPDWSIEKFDGLFFAYILLALSMVFMIVSTLISNWKLYLFYYEELSKLQKELKEDGIKRIRNGFFQVIDFYAKKKTAKLK